MADSRVPELVADLEAQTVAFLVAERIEHGAAVMLSKKLSRHLTSNWGGQLIYFPKNQGGKLGERDREIYEAFNGRNHNELAAKYNLAVQQVYKIVKMGKQQFLLQAKQGLFDD